MLPENKLKALLDLISSASKEELVWMSGYLEGVIRGSAAAPAPQVASNAAVPAVNKITILYGTETGNSKKLAAEFAAKAKQNKIVAKVVAMDQYKLTDLAKEEYLLAVVSTHGDGEPPAAAKNFYDHIHLNGFKLEKLKYSVLALGDTSYPLFCKTGEDVDLQLNKLGGSRIAPIQKCDVDYDEDAAKWFDAVLKTLTAPAVAPKAPAGTTVLPAVPGVKKTGKQNYTGAVTAHVNLNDRGSNKTTWHIELEAEGLQYQCGDSIGIVPENDSQLVTDIIATANVDGNKSLEYKKEKATIYELLKRKINVIHLTERLVQHYATVTGHTIPAGRADLLDLLKQYPIKSRAQFDEILVGLNAMSPRLYTIASSPAAHDGEVHIIVAKDVYEVKGRERFGLCSDYLGKLAKGKKQNFFIQPNKRFRLPAEDKDIIMVGPGTGIAAFRSFLAERDATGASGKNWLFFGEQHFVSDFLYQTEIQNWHSTGVLSKVSLAFSRDQQEKIYVQHRMKEHAAELYQWLEGGASFFVCGKKDPMSHDVEKTLLQIIQEQGKKTEAEAKHYLEQMEEQGRYEKDVY
ncbi:MAG TPA: flavodoxin domain-containing protein [Ferruginibacter sp.]|nr:flavodoxin domain-containing protein [Ferruginibacter sp.]HMP21213.1 flavodoxin domain-containing protein [Ferruginibacter sp.]